MVKKNEMLEELKRIRGELTQIRLLLSRKLFKRERIYYDNKTNQWVSESEINGEK